MLLWIEAVTDRSQNDVYRVLELLEKDGRISLIQKKGNGLLV